MFGILRPLPALIVLTGFYLIASGALVWLGDYTSDETDLLWYLIVSLMMAWWVQEDKKQREFHAPYEFCAFVFFAWLFVVPYYLLQTRKWRGLGGAILVVALYYLPSAFWYGVEEYWWDSSE